MNLTQIIWIMTTVYIGKEQVHIEWMRRTPGPERRAEALAHAFEGAAQTYDLSLGLVVATGFLETGFNGNLVSSRGAVGVMQMHSRGKAGRQYLRKCKRSSVACDEASILLGAEELRRAINHCGSVAEGVGFYRAGRCYSDERTMRVIRLANDLDACLQRDECDKLFARRPVWKQAAKVPSPSGW